MDASSFAHSTAQQTFILQRSEASDPARVHFAQEEPSPARPRQQCSSSPTFRSSPTRRESRSPVHTTEITASSLVVVDGFKDTRYLSQPGDYIHHRFDVRGYTWFFDFCPLGDSDENRQNRQYVCFSLSLSRGNNTAGDPPKVHIKCSFIDPIPADHPADAEKRAVIGCSPYDRHDTGCSFRVLWRKVVAESNAVLKDDRFTVRCHFRIFTAPNDVAVPLPDILRDLRALRLSGDCTDVTFQVAGGQTFAAHRCVLAAQSPVFRSQLFGPMKDSVMHIDDMDASVFELFLGFMYGEPSMPETEEDKDVTMWEQLLVAADRYDFSRLRLICERKLRGDIGVTTVTTILIKRSLGPSFED